jgi:putative flippase GtrA
MSIAQRISTAIDSLYIKALEPVISRQFFRYGVCGAINMMLDAIWYFVIFHFVVAQRYIDLDFVIVSPHIASLIIVFPITFTTGFLLNRYVAFQVMAYRSRGQLIRYAISVGGAILLNYVLMKLFVEHCHLWPTPSKVLTTIISSLYSFIAAKYFTFRKV